MNYRIGVKPGKAVSIVGMLVAILFVVLGIVVFIPLIGFFAIIWTVVAALIAIFYGWNAFSRRGLSAYQVDIESPERDSADHRNQSTR